MGIRARRGATLMELLVMMAVIAVLSSLLFPAFVTVKEKAKQTVCSYNEGQIGLALAQYVQDNDGGMPTASNWAYGLNPYMKQPKIFHCPDYTGDKKISYAMNSLLDTVPTSNVTMPSSVVTFFETASPAWEHPDPTYIGDPDPNGICVGFDFTDGNHGSLYRHTSLQDKSKGADPRLNYVFADGHVKFLAYSHVEDLTAQNDGLSANADCPIGSFKPGATVTFNYMAPK